MDVQIGGFALAAAERLRARAAAGGSGTMDPISASTRGSLSTTRPSIARSPAAIDTRSPGKPTTRLMAGVPSTARSTQRS